MFQVNPPLACRNTIFPNASTLCFYPLPIFQIHTVLTCSHTIQVTPHSCLTVSHFLPWVPWLKYPHCLCTPTIYAHHHPHTFILLSNLYICNYVYISDWDFLITFGLPQPPICNDQTSSISPTTNLQEDPPRGSLPNIGTLYSPFFIPISMNRMAFLMGTRLLVNSKPLFMTYSNSIWQFPPLLWMRIEHFSYTYTHYIASKTITTI